jgi:hypothetical protein
VQVFELAANITLTTGQVEQATGTQTFTFDMPQPVGRTLCERLLYKGLCAEAWLCSSCASGKLGLPLQMFHTLSACQRAVPCADAAAGCVLLSAHICVVLVSTGDSQQQQR